jgi:hypothetical protein
MPRYEFFCHNCKKLFLMVLCLVDYEEGDILMPPLWQQGSRAVLVRLQCHHVEEERLIIASAAVANSHLGFVARLGERGRRAYGFAQR